ncbi:RNA polymerase sigma factor [Chloroflexi bacterium TSY]|nr:RNA polymerase sigma factor [Chloroflexi bacterium TSY]
MSVQTRTIKNDQELAQSAKQDEAAFTELYRRHVDRVYRFCLLRVGNVEDAQDLTGQTFMAVLESIGRYRPSGSFAAWLLRIARNKTVDHLRKKKNLLPLEPVWWTQPSNEILEDSLEARVSKQMEQERLVRALHSLSPERADALYLRFFGELSNGEVAQVMEKSEAAVKMLIHRGIQDLRERLMPMLELAELEVER